MELFRFKAGGKCIRLTSCVCPVHVNVSEAIKAQERNVKKDAVSLDDGEEKEEI